MSKAITHYQDSEANIDMTPMLDIVFIMLIFFIVSTSFLQTTGLEVLRPPTKAQSLHPAPAIVIQIKENGDIWMNNRMVDVARIPANIETLLTQHNHTQVLVDADDSAKHSLVVKVLDQISTIEELGISIVSR
ncbi:MAG: biopolymer transporter ExbD [Algicola sp.]|nr:biopolymer transporter ExbD [Algicola sp.]